ncbi:MAG: hypothetical protein ACPGN3_09340 [Opitutales bacterium]
MNRRKFCSSFALASLGLNARALFAQHGKSFSHVPFRPITRGPQFHWFGYYDKFQFDPTDRYILGNQVKFEHRTPKADDEIVVGMVDTDDGDKWIDLGTSKSWGWQQGCMLQFAPGEGSRVIWNDREGDRFVSRVLDIKTGKQKTLPYAIYSLSPDGEFAVGADFARIQHFRPGYGYKGGKDPFAGQRAPMEGGIYRMDLETGETKVIVRLGELAQLPYLGKDISQKWHYVNHLLVSPDSERLIFLNRWRDQDSSAGRYNTRMFTVNQDGSDLHHFTDYTAASHFIWRDSENIMAFINPNGKPRRFYMMKDKTQEHQVIAPETMPTNGHNTYLPIGDNDWVLNDTYPDPKTSNQTPYLYQKSTGKRFDLGDFHAPGKYRGEWRCDTHPRSSRDGMKVCIDSPHGGNGRQMYLLDISSIVA